MTNETQPGDESNAGGAGPGDASFRVLVICTANQCRSPMAEHMLRHASSAIGLNWAVESAGVLALPGQPMHPWVVEVLAQRSMSAEGWVSRRLDRPMIERADLVLAAAAEHRRAVAVLHPRAAGRTFTLLQFARLVSLAGPLAGDDPTRVGAEMLERVARVRANLQPGQPSRDDLPDPIGKRRRVLDACATQIETAIERVLAAVPWP